MGRLTAGADHRVSSRMSPGGLCGGPSTAQTNRLRALLRDGGYPDRNLAAIRSATPLAALARRRTTNGASRLNHRVEQPGVWLVGLE